VLSKRETARVVPFHVADAELAMLFSFDDELCVMVAVAAPPSPSENVTFTVTCQMSVHPDGAFQVCCFGVKVGGVPLEVPAPTLCRVPAGEAAFPLESWAVQVNWQLFVLALLNTNFENGVTPGL
jgi:hypothetical protein